MSKFIGQFQTFCIYFLFFSTFLFGFKKEHFFFFDVVCSKRPSHIISEFRIVIFFFYFCFNWQSIENQMKLSSVYFLEYNFLLVLFIVCFLFWLANATSKEMRTTPTHLDQINCFKFLKDYQMQVSSKTGPNVLWPKSALELSKILWKDHFFIKTVT